VGMGLYPSGWREICSSCGVVRPCKMVQYRISKNGDRGVFECAVCGKRFTVFVGGRCREREADW
jgi:hypothetical protein